ncbi:MAG: hypothetical protein JXQ23_12290 [Clostridia bacterium]|nr:hypothetical protein [Clostridia bacterium]
MGCLLDGKMAALSFSITEIFGFSYDQQLIHKNVSGIDCSKKYILTDDKGSEIAADFKKAEKSSLIIEFTDSLASYQTNTYYLQEKKSELPAELHANKRTGDWVITNGLISLSIPRSGIYETDVPGPIISFTNNKLTPDFTTAISNCKKAVIKTAVSKGRASKTVTLNYLFDKGEYHCTIRMVRGANELIITEKFKGNHTMISMSIKQFRGERAFVRMHTPDYLKGEKSEDWERLDFTLENEHDVIARIKPFFGWGKDDTPLLSLYDKKHVISIVGAYASKWSHGEDNKLIVNNDQTIEADISNGKRCWVLSIDSINDDRKEIKEISPRRIGYQDNLTGTTMIHCTYRAERLASIYNGPDLDKYSRWIFDYENMDSMEYPGLLIKKGEIREVRQKLEKFEWFRQTILQHNGFDEFLDDKAGYYLATGESKVAFDSMAAIEKWFDVRMSMFHQFGYAFHDLVAIAFTRPFRNAVIDFDLIAYDNSISDIVKKRVIQKIVYLLYCMADNDYWPDKIKSGFGKGNVNFHSDYFTAFGIGACLIKGHPLSDQWIQYARLQFELDLKRCINKSYAFVEAPNYQAYTLMYYSFFIQTYKNRGICQFFESRKLKGTFSYLADLQTPEDPRMGICMIPSLGDTDINYHSQQLQVVFAYAAKFTRDIDPVFSRKMMTAFQKAGEIGIVPMVDRNCAFKYGLCLVDIFLEGEENPKWKDIAYEGLGTISRTKNLDGYLLVKSGYFNEHYDHDEGSLIFYAKETPILIDYGTQYNPPVDQSFLHNRISIREKSDLTRQRGQVTMFKGNKETSVTSFLYPMTTVQEWPKWPPRDRDFSYRLLKTPVTIDPVSWERTVFYLKELDALYITDDISGNQKTQFDLQILAKSYDKANNFYRFNGPYGVDTFTYIHDNDLEEVRVESWSHEGLDEKRCDVFDGDWHDYQWIYKKGLAKGDEESRILRIFNKSEKTSYKVLVFAGKEPFDSVDFLNDGKVIIIKHCDSVHIVASSKHPFEFYFEDIHFIGQYLMVTRKDHQVKVKFNLGSLLEIDGKRYDRNI